MKKVIACFKYFVYFIVGYAIFNFIYAITQKIALENLSIKANFISLFSESLGQNMYIYIILYLTIVGIMLIHNIYITKKLNKKLQNVKERGNNNEK